MGDKNIIGQKMKIARAMHKPPMAQSDLLAKIHLNGMDTMSQATLSKIENGDRSVNDSEIIVIAKALNVDVLWLLGLKEEKI